MELLVIIGLIVLVGAVVLFRKFRGTDQNLDMSTGNPPHYNDTDDK